MIESTVASDSSSNPIADSKRGQEALQDFISGVRDMMFPFFACMDPKKRTSNSTNQTFAAAQQCVETMQQMRLDRESLKETFRTVKEYCDRLPETNASKLIPYVDDASENIVPPKSEHSTVDEANRPVSAVDMHEHDDMRRYLQVSKELDRIRVVLTETLWELNDLLDPNIVKQ